MDYLLPAAAYRSPSRLARGRVLNTIIEDQHEGSVFRSSEGSGTDTDEGTVIYNPVDVNRKVKITGPAARCSPLPPMEKQPLLFVGNGGIRRRKSSDELYEDTDEETEFSDCSTSSLHDSISSRPTSFATDSDNESIVSGHSKTRNHYPAIKIPPINIWPSLTGSAKASSTVPPTPPKIPVSPAALSLLPRFVPAINAPPSLDGSSMTSDHVSCISAPITPERYNVAPGQGWDLQHPVRLRGDGDFVRDASDSGSTSPQEEVVIEEPIGWDDIGNFPRIPGATPQEVSPISPNIRDLDLLRPATPSDQGVLLPSDALETLHQLALYRNSDLISEASVGDQTEMREEHDSVRRPKSADGATPASGLSDYSFSQLSIPSPGGFFASLKPGTRHTWYPGTNRQSNPPSSTTAENFYNVPWHQPQAVVEQVIEVDDTDTDGPPTARQPPIKTPTQVESANKIGDTTSPASSETWQIQSNNAEAAKESPLSTSTRYEYEEAYEIELMESAGEHLDRTTSWLTAQLSYLSALRETNPANNMSETPCSRVDFVPEENDSPEPSVTKMVRFLDEARKSQSEDDLKMDHQEEHAFYQAFQRLAHCRGRRDGFIQGASRFEAIQASRVALLGEHISQLCGDFEVQEHVRPKYSGPFSQNPRATGVFDYTPEQLVFVHAEREKGVLDQVSPTFWIVEALKYLNGGKLLLSDASKRLAKASVSQDDPNCISKRRMRALDLGGNTSCDWAWHCAQEYPNVKIYTVTTSPAATKSTVTGPPNHRLILASQLWKLPFKDNHFDLISARSLHAMLRDQAVPGLSETGEYDACLRECYRVLKPGGYLEFTMMESEMTHAGPLGSAMSVEFGFKLKTRGYDPLPTRSFLGRLRQANFVDIKRAWMFLPAGSPKRDAHVPCVAPGLFPPPGDDPKATNDPVGSTGDISNVTGLVGSWMWEQWMLKLQMEMGVREEKLLQGIAAVIDESKNCEAGWRCLSGWARKPQSKSNHRRRRANAPTMETVQIKMA